MMLSWFGHPIAWAWVVVGWLLFMAMSPPPGRKG